MKLVEMIRKDKEIQELLVQYREKFGHHRPFSIWEDGSIETYKEKLKKSIQDNKPY